MQSFIGQARFSRPFGIRLWHMLLAEAFKCCCGRLFPSAQHLRVHFLSCTVDKAATHSLGLYSWFMHMFGRNLDRMNWTPHKEAAGWRNCIPPDHPLLGNYSFEDLGDSIDKVIPCASSYTHRRRQLIPSSIYFSTSSPAANTTQRRKLSFRET